MKKITLSIVLFSMVFVAYSQQPITSQPVAPAAIPATPANPNAAEMTFETELHDFGTIKKGDNGTFEFKFKNTGKEPLVISNARGSCGCTVPSWPKDPIKVGESSSIKVTYDTKRVGGFSKTVTITSNAKTQEKVISIKGKVEDVPAEDVFPGVQKNGTPFETK